MSVPRWIAGVAVSLAAVQCASERSLVLNASYADLDARANSCWDACAKERAGDPDDIFACRKTCPATRIWSASCEEARTEVPATTEGNRVAGAHSSVMQGAKCMDDPGPSKRNRALLIVGGIILIPIVAVGTAVAVVLLEQPEQCGEHAGEKRC